MFEYISYWGFGIVTTVKDDSQTIFCSRGEKVISWLFDSQDNENFVEDGIQIEPFNLNKEREEGYFDADGNFVEYVNENEIKV